MEEYIIYKDANGNLYVKGDIGYGYTINSNETGIWDYCPIPEDIITKLCEKTQKKFEVKKEKEMGIQKTDITPDMQDFLEGKLTIHITNWRDYLCFHNHLWSADIKLSNAEDFPNTVAGYDPKYPYFYMQTPEERYMNANHLYENIQKRIKNCKEYAELDFVANILTRAGRNNEKNNHKHSHEQCNMMTISTVHITPEMAEAMKDGEFMDGEIGILCYEKSDYGFFIPIIEDYMPTNPIMAQLFDYAKENNCQWLCLDQDGPEVEKLPTYDWNEELER